MLTKSFSAVGIECAPPLDVIYNPEFDVLNPLLLAVVVGVLASHLVDLMHLVPPCSSFPSIPNASLATRVRTLECPDGIPGLTGIQAEKVRLRHALADTAAVFVEV